MRCNEADTDIMNQARCESIKVNVRGSAQETQTRAFPPTTGLPGTGYGQTECSKAEKPQEAAAVERRKQLASLGQEGGAKARNKLSRTRRHNKQEAPERGERNTDRPDRRGPLHRRARLG